jgi:mono/diheme cytochrome c family protein
MRHAAIAIVLAACSTSEPRSSTTTTELTAEEAWLQRALPALRAGSCTTCHGNPSANTIDFLAGTTDLEIRDTLLASGIVDQDMFASPLLTKGIHEGPYLDQAQVQAIVAWLALELGD